MKNVDRYEYGQGERVDSYEWEYWQEVKEEINKLQIMNKVIITGRTGQNPEFGKMKSEKSYANFSVAITESYKDKNTGEWVNLTDWVSCSSFGNTADYINKYIQKGDRVSIVGKLKQSSWDDKEGNKRSTLQLIVEHIEKWDWEKSP